MEDATGPVLTEGGAFPAGPRSTGACTERAAPGASRLSASAASRLSAWRGATGGPGSAASCRGSAPVGPGVPGSPGLKGAALAPLLTAPSEDRETRNCSSGSDPLQAGEGVPSSACSAATDAMTPELLGRAWGSGPRTGSGADGEMGEVAVRVACGGAELRSKQARAGRRRAAGRPVPGTPGPGLCRPRDRHRRVRGVRPCRLSSPLPGPRGRGPARTRLRQPTCPSTCQRRGRPRPCRSGRLGQGRCRRA